MYAVTIFAFFLLILVINKFIMENGYKQLKNKYLISFFVSIVVALILDCLFISSNKESKIIIYFLYIAYFLLTLTSYLFVINHFKLSIKSKTNYILLPLFSLLYLTSVTHLFITNELTYIADGNVPVVLLVCFVLALLLISIIKNRAHRKNMQSEFLYCLIPLLFLLIEVLIDNCGVFVPSFVLLFYLITSNFNTSTYLRDSLTGARNAFSFANNLKSYYQTKHYIGVYFIDADDLKKVNDNYGHLAGDRLLKSIVYVLNQCSTNDYVYRIGGDEFVLIEEFDKIEDVPLYVATIKESLRLYNQNNGSALSFSIGWAVAKNATEVMDALEEADKRMYENKHGASKARKR